MKIKVKEIVLTGLLTAIAIMIPLIMPPVPPFKIIIPPIFTATLAAHVPLVIAMFISPFSAVCTALGSSLGFFMYFSDNPTVGARAFMHVFFVVVGAIMLRKNQNIYLIAIITMIVHAISEMFVVYLFANVFGFINIGERTMNIVQLIVGSGTSIHHIVDFTIALIIYKTVVRTKSIL